MDKWISPQMHHIHNFLHTDKAGDEWRNASSLNRSRGFSCTTTDDIILNSGNQEDLCLKNACSQAHHNTEGFAAQGGLGYMQLVRIQEIPTGFQFSIYKRWKTASHRIHDISWLDNQLLCGGDNGKVLLYTMGSELHTLDDDELTGWYEEEGTLSLELPSIFQVGRSELGTSKVRNQQRIQSVDINQLNRDAFLCVENNKLHILSFTKGISSIQSIKGSNGQLETAQWDPHNQHLLCIAGKNNSLKILDCRAMQRGIISDLVPWSRENAHKLSIRQVQWSPFVPYWLASCGNDSLVNIWDLRYQRDPVLQLSGHDNVVRSLSWSPTHADLLISGSTDQTVKIWSLRTRPHHCLDTINSFHDPVVKVDFSISRSRSFLALSASGAYTAVNLTPLSLKDLAISKYPDKKLKEKTIEMKLFNRQFKSAFRDIIQLANEYKHKNQVNEALKLLELCKARDPQKDNIKDRDPQIRFYKELEQYSYFIPPNYRSKNYKSSLKTYEKTIDNIVLNLEILKLVEKKDGRLLPNLAGKIIRTIEQNCNQIEVGTIYDVLSLYLLYNFREGMTFGIKVGEIYKQKGCFKQFEMLGSKMLGEIILETDNPNFVEESFIKKHQFFGDSERLLAELSLQQDCMCFLWEDVDSSAKIIEIVNNFQRANVHSTSIIRTYLNSFLARNEIERNIIASIEWIDRLKPDHFFSKRLQEQLDIVSIPLLRSLADESILEYDEEDQESLVFLEQSLRVSVSVICLAKYCPWLPFPVDEVSEWLSLIKTNLQECISAFTEEKTSKHDIKVWATNFFQYVQETSDLFPSVKQGKEMQKVHSLANDILHVIHGCLE